MICPNCGKEASEGAKFCLDCGTKLEVFAPAQSVPTPVNSVPTPVNSVPTPVNSVPTSMETNTPAPAESVSGGAVTMEKMPQAQEFSADEPVKGTALKPEKSGSKKGKIIGASVAAAAALLVGGGALGWTFGRANIIHTFLGDQKYAASVAQKQLDALADSPVQGMLVSAVGTPVAMSSANSSSSSSMDGEDSDEPSFDLSPVLTSLASSVKDMVPDKGVTVDYNAKLNFSDELLESMADDMDMEKEKAKELIDAIGDLHFGGSLKFTEEGIALASQYTENGNDLLKLCAYYDDETKAYYLALPNASDKSLKFCDKAFEIDMDAVYSAKSGNDDYKKMLRDISDAYSKNLKNAELSYETEEVSIGEVSFNGKVISAKFEGEELADLLRDVGDAILESDFIDSLGADVSEFKDDIEDAADALEDGDVKASLKIDFMMNANNSVAGTRAVFEVRNSRGDKETTSVVYLNTKSGVAMSVKADGTEQIRMVQEQETRTSGKYVITVNDGGDKVKLTVKYEELSMKKVLGEQRVLGKFSFALPEEFGEAEIVDGFVVDKFEIEISEDGGALVYTFKISDKNKSSVSMKFAISEGVSDDINADSMHVNNAIDAVNDPEAVSDYGTEVLEYLANQWSNSKFMNAIPVDDEMTVAEMLKLELDRMNREKLLVKNYKDYNDSTVRNANRMASGVYSAVRSTLNNVSLPSKNPVTVKGYFDPDGKFTVTDNGGISGVDTLLGDKLSGYNSDYKNAHVEFLLWSGRGPLVGVSVTMTDDNGNLPAALPGHYNFLDKKYPWGTAEDVNYSGAFVVGAYPTLANGEGGETEAKDKELAQKVTAYNTYAKMAYESFREYLADKGVTIKNMNSSTANFNVSNDWKVSGLSSYYFSKSIDVDDLSEYMSGRLSDLDGGYVFIYFYDNKVVGAAVSDSYISGIDAAHFSFGVTGAWSYMDGLNSSGKVIGTSPVLPALGDKLPDSVVNELAGTWNANRSSDTVTFTRDQLSDLQSLSLTTSAFNLVLSNGDRISYYYNSGYIYYNNTMYNKN
ncbi:MAG: zinc ribbon domain-containing protein [Oscillospiraceae bacterium]|nr:zinc ribbon domain-containing protein [Oscillospiraceae bacterium]